MRIKEGTEMAIGAVVFAAVVLASLSILDSREPVSSDTYRIKGSFTKADGITVGSDVMAAGIAVGKVVDMRLDERYMAIVTMEVDAKLELDTDTNASIISESLFGTKFIRLDIGGGDAIIEDGGSIFYTEASLIIGDLLNMIVARGKSRAGKDNSDGR